MKIHLRVPSSVLSARLRSRAVTAPQTAATLMPHHLVPPDPNSKEEAAGRLFPRQEEEEEASFSGSSRSPAEPTQPALVTPTEINIPGTPATVPVVPATAPTEITMATEAKKNHTNTQTQVQSETQSDVPATQVPSEHSDTQSDVPSERSGTADYTGCGGTISQEMMLSVIHSSTQELQDLASGVLSVGSGDADTSASGDDGGGGGVVASGGRGDASATRELSDARQSFNGMDIEDLEFTSNQASRQSEEEGHVVSRVAGLRCDRTPRALEVRRRTTHGGHPPRCQPAHSHSAAHHSEGSILPNSAHWTRPIHARA